MNGLVRLMKDEPGFSSGADNTPKLFQIKEGSKIENEQVSIKAAQMQAMSILKPDIPDFSQIPC